MERLGYDELLVVFNKLPRSGQRSFYLVSKKFLKTACIRLWFLHNSFPNMLYDILPSSPNLMNFACSKPLSNTHMKLLAQSCPELTILSLRLKPDIDTDFVSDFDDDGLCALVNACRKLHGVNLSNRLRVGDAGVVSLVSLSQNLNYLILDRCVGVSDESLKLIGETNIYLLDLRGCYLITDSGLKYLGSGNLNKCLKSLTLAECDRITDKGIIYLKQMVCLLHLNLSKCGVGVTDYGIVALSSQIPKIRSLNLSWLIKITNISLTAIASNCLKLEAIILTECGAINGEGLHAFTNHEKLYDFVLFSCHNISWEDVESFALNSSESRKIELGEKKIHCSIIGKCLINWD